MTSWFYCDPQGEQKCLPERVLLNLLTTEVGGSLTSGGRASAWTEGMSGWAQLRECPVFKDVCSLYHETLWFVSWPEPMGVSEAVSTATAIKWFRSGAMTLDTLVHSKLHTGDGWVAAGLVPALRGVLEGKGGAGSGGSAAAAADDDDDEAIPQEALAALARASSSAANATPAAAATATNKASAARADKYTKEGSGGEGGEGTKKKRKRSKPKTNWVYVEGLPADVTEDELKKHFSLVGLIAINMDDQSPKIKIYRDAQDSLCKGDASLCYHAATSVEMALTILDGGAIRPAHTIKVSRANFTAPTATDASAALEPGAAATADADSAPPRKAARAAVDTKDDKESKEGKEQRMARAKISRAAMQQALSWDDDHESLTHAPTHILRIVILENMFTPNDFDDPTFSDELEKDVAQGCGAMGTIEKITFFSKHPDGVVAVKFLSANAAADCVAKMHGRFFGGRKLKASYWDRITDYTSVQADEVVAHEQEQEQERQQEFGAWLEDQVDLPEELRLQVES